MLDCTPRQDTQPQTTGRAHAAPAVHVLSLSALHGQLESLAAQTPIAMPVMQDHGRPLRGIVVGLGLALPFWAAIGWLLTGVF